MDFREYHGVSDNWYVNQATEYVISATWQEMIDDIIKAAEEFNGTICNTFDESKQSDEFEVLSDDEFLDAYKNMICN